MFFFFFFLIKSKLKTQSDTLVPEVHFSNRHFVTFLSQQQNGGRVGPARPTCNPPSLEVSWPKKKKRKRDTISHANQNDHKSYRRTKRGELVVVLIPYKSPAIGTEVSFRKCSPMNYTIWSLSLKYCGVFEKLLCPYDK